MDVELIEKFINDAFPRLPIEERQDLINTAWIFFAENNIFSFSAMDSETLKKLKKHLVSEMFQVSWQEIGIEDLKSKSAAKTDFNVSEDESLSFFNQQSEQTNSFEIKQELENATAHFESRKEELKAILPPLLFEALHRKIATDAPIDLTVGFEEASLKILCRRALMRIRWVNS